MKMKRSNQFLVLFGLITLAVLFLTNFNLVQEYNKIDLSDPFKNYVSLTTKPYSVLILSGSNGYPIEVRNEGGNGLKVLRSRVDHVVQNVISDTLFIEFTGANISRQQSRETNTPPSIIIQRETLPEIIAADIHGKISSFVAQKMSLTLKGDALIEIKDSHFKAMDVNLSHQAQIEFSNRNSTDSLLLTMSNTSVVFLKNINLQYIEQNLGDSISLVLSNDVFNSLVE